MKFIKIIPYLLILLIMIILFFDVSSLLISIISFTGIILSIVYLGNHTI